MSSSDLSSETTVPTLLEITARSHYKNSEVVKYYSNITIYKALDSKADSIGLIAKKDEEIAHRCITNMFKATALYFDSTLSQAKADLIATEILAKYEYRNLKLEDILAICIKIKEGEIYKLTPAKILAEIKKYSKEREKLAIERSIRASETNKSSINSNIELRVKKAFKSLPNINKIAAKRTQIKNKFK